MVVSRRATACRWKSSTTSPSCDPNTVASCSGFMQWLHAAALIVFLAPYFGFVVRQSLYARFNPPTNGSNISVAEAVFRYVWNGGVNWQEGFSDWTWSFVFFLTAASYNILRGALLWKTKKLEIQQDASGLPAMFSLKDGWCGWAYPLARWMFYVNLVVVLLNTMHFLGQRVPGTPFGTDSAAVQEKEP